MKLSRELKNGAASLKAAPGYVLTVVLTLGITLGVLVSMFNLNYLLNFEPLPYPEQDKLVVANWEHRDDGKLRFPHAQNYPGLLEMAKIDGLFEKTSFIKYGEEIQLNDIKKPKLKAAYVEPSFMEILEAPFALGRAFQESEAKDSNNPVVVISYDLWQQHFAAQPDIIGQKMQFNDITFTIIGVTAQQFSEPQIMAAGLHTQVWLPWDFLPEVGDDFTNWEMFEVNQFMFGKIDESQTIKQVEHVLNTHINDRFKAEMSGVAYFEKRKINVTLPKLEQVILGDSTSRTFMMLMGVLVLMLIAAVNITNLVMARTANNHRKYSIQAALGARKKHIFTSIFSETWLVMTMASILAVVIALICNSLLVTHTQEYIPRVSELSINVATLLFSFGVAWLLSLLFAAATVHQVKYAKLAPALQSSGKGSGLQISKTVRNALMVSQVALSAILVTSNVYVLEDSLDAVNQPLGFNSDNMTFIDVELGGANAETRDEWASLVKDVKAELIAHPAISELSTTSNAPMARTTNMEWTIAVTTELGGGDRIGPGVAMIDENFLPILEIPLVEGRNFSANEAIERPRIAVVNETMARMVNPTGSAIDKPLYIPRQKDPFVIVGVVKDITVPEQDDSPRMYIPSINSASMMVKFNEGQTLNVEQFNQLLSQVNSQIYLYDIYSMNSIHQDKISLEQVFAWCSAALGLLSLVLAGIGIYGMFSYTVALRKFELGIRMAIGATPKRIAKLVLGDALTPIVIGLFTSILLLIGLYVFINNNTQYVVTTQFSGLILAAILIVTTAMLAGLMAVRKTISRAAIHALNG